VVGLGEGMTLRQFDAIPVRFRTVIYTSLHRTETINMLL
jgi:hypothetical protein